MSEQQGRNLKVVLLGDTGVGKTSLINRYIKNEFDPDSPSTIAGSFISKTFKFPEYDNILQMEIWDTAGQEQYKALTKLYYQNADAIILVYDITRSQSFEEVKTYYKSISETVDVKRVHFVVVGNKSDLYEQEQVPKETAQQYAKEINGMFKLTSCLNATGINEMFEELGFDLLSSANEMHKGRNDSMRLNNSKFERKIVKNAKDKEKQYDDCLC